MCIYYSLEPLATRYLISLAKRLRERWLAPRATRAQYIYLFLFLTRIADGVEFRKPDALFFFLTVSVCIAFAERERGGDCIRREFQLGLSTFHARKHRRMRAPLRSVQPIDY